MLGANKGCRKDAFFDTYVVFDLETTGISCQNDRIVEISAVKVQNGSVTDEFTSLVNPEMPIPFYASRVNGITDDMVADAPVIEEALSEFLHFVGDLPLVGHNIQSFDMRFIWRDCERIYGEYPDNDFVDTLLLSRMFHPEIRHHKLGDMAQLFGIENEQAHRALSDAKTNQRVYTKLAETATKAKPLRSCPKCGAVLVKRNGKYGAFWGCSAYPGCRFTQDA